MTPDGRREASRNREMPRQAEDAACHKPNAEKARLTITQRRKPSAVGRRMAAAVHFRLPVSFLIVRQVVEQGQWKRQKIIMHTAVLKVQP